LRVCPASKDRRGFMAVMLTLLSPARNLST
jgi:hypothetical protein